MILKTARRAAIIGAACLLTAGCEDDDSSHDDMPQPQADESTTNNSAHSDGQDVDTFSIFGVWKGSSGVNASDSLAAIADDIESSPNDDFLGSMLRAGTPYPIEGHYPGDPAFVPDILKVVLGKSMDVDIWVEDSVRNVIEEWALHINSDNSLSGFGVGVNGGDPTGAIFEVHLSQ